MSDDGDGRPASNVRHGLGLLCIAAIGVAIGLAANGGSDDRAFGEGPSVGETIGQVIGGLGGLLALIALAYIAYGLLRD